jgi:two-component system OmpR family sensor kinase
MSRISTRTRLTLAFALAMALLLGAFGGFLYFRLRSSLDGQVDAGLRAQAEAVAALVRRGGELGTGSSLVEKDESFAQVVGADGAVRDGSITIPLLSAAELERARSQTVFVERGSLPGLDSGPFRLLATPVDTAVVVTGASLEDRDEALGSFLTQLLLGGSIALLLSGLAGYALATAALRPVVARLEAGLARERRFVADASHELRTPLSLLQSELELALSRPRSDEEMRRALASAAEEVDRLTRLAEDLLVLAHEDGGRLPLRRAPVQLRDLLESVARRFEPRTAELGRELELSGASDEAIVADRLRLEQALGNLVDNALRHGKGTVRLDAESRNGTITLRVSDEGDGFPPDFLPRAFERFTRADEARSRGATGLGLAIVAAVARAHGFTVHAANRDGGGASVSLGMPGHYT